MILGDFTPTPKSIINNIVKAYGYQDVIPFSTKAVQEDQGCTMEFFRCLVSFASGTRLQKLKMTTIHNVIFSASYIFL